jgi:hypothetical protein
LGNEGGLHQSPREHPVGTTLLNFSGYKISLIPCTV